MAADLRDPQPLEAMASGARQPRRPRSGRLTHAHVGASSCPRSPVWSARRTWPTQWSTDSYGLLGAPVATRQRWSEKEEHAIGLQNFGVVVLRMQDSAREDRAGSLGSQPCDGDRRRHRRCVGMQAHEPRRGGLENRTCSGCPRFHRPRRQQRVDRQGEIDVHPAWCLARGACDEDDQQPGRASFPLEEIRQRGEPVTRLRSVVRLRAHGTTRKEQAQALEVDRRQGRP
jgi:hypothetical protein